MKVVFLGSGNLATRLSLEMHRKGAQIVQIYSQTAVHAEQLANQLGCCWTTTPESVLTDADLYVFSLKDTVLKEVIAKVRPNTGLWVHTAGSMPMDVFEDVVENYGVLYPLQTFSKAREVNFQVIPFFIEANSYENEDKLQQIAKSVTRQVRLLSSEKRKQLHLAAVFACNFTNHIYALAGKLLEEQGLSMEVLLPLIDETAAKIHEMTPVQAQTGPAIRYDENVIRNHIDMLADANMKTIYQLMSQSIHKEAQHE